MRERTTTTARAHTAQRWCGTALLLLSTAGLAACGDTTPAPTPSETVASPLDASPTPSQTPSPEAIAPPEMPAEMNRTDEVGAVAAARYFMESYGYAYASGDVTEWDRFSGQTCNFCHSVSEDVRTTTAAGKYQTGGELVSLTDVRVAGYDEQLAIFGVQVGYAFTGGTIYGADGHEEDTFPSQEGYIILDVAHSVRGWVLIGGDAQDGPVS